MAYGASEDNVRQPSVAASKAQMDLVRMLGVNAVRITSMWTPGQVAPDAGEASVLSNVDQAAKLSGLEVTSRSSTRAAARRR
jgi:hypothetical protein